MVRLKRVSIGLLGLGTVGSGVVKIIQQNGDQIARRAGSELHIKRVLVRSLEKERRSSRPTH